MSRRTVSRASSGENSDPVRSFRCANDIWGAATRRAETIDRVNISEAMRLLLEAYGRGMINLPRMVMTYDGGSGGQPAAGQGSGPASPGSGGAPG